MNFSPFPIVNTTIRSGNLRQQNREFPAVFTVIRDLMAPHASRICRGNVFMKRWWLSQKELISSASPYPQRRSTAFVAIRIGCRAPATVMPPRARIRCRNHARTLTLTQAGHDAQTEPARFGVGFETQPRALLKTAKPGAIQTPYNTAIQKTGTRSIFTLSVNALPDSKVLASHPTAGAKNPASV